MRVRFVLSELFNSLRRNASMAVSVVLVTMISVFLLGLGLLAQRQVDTMKDYWYDRVNVTVFLCVDGSSYANCGKTATTEAQRTVIDKQLRSLSYVSSVEYESSEQAYARFKEQFKNSPLGRAGGEKFADSFRVKLSDPTKFDVVSSSMVGMPGVGLVQDQKRTFDNFFRFMNVASWATIALAGLMSLCAVLLMATTIRQTAFSRRRETGIMRLVGATNFTIRMPFVLETVVASLVGAALGLGLLWAAVRYGVSDYLSNAVIGTAFIGVADVYAVAPWVALGIFLLAVVTSWVTLRRYLRV